MSKSLQGRVTAKVKLKSGNLRSLESLEGDYDIRLDQCQTLLLPGLSKLTTAVGVPSPGAVTFGQTVLKGDLRRNTVHVKQMTMQSQNARMWVDGRLGLSGAMDLNVVADAGSLSTINLLAATVNPISLLRRRLLFLHLGGSVRSPVVQPRTDQFIAQEMVLFFVPVVSLK